jgi:hypothetical protein
MLRRRIARRLTVAGAGAASFQWNASVSPTGRLSHCCDLGMAAFDAGSALVRYGAMTTAVPAPLLMRTEAGLSGVPDDVLRA